MGIVMLNNKVLMSGNQMALYVPPTLAKGSIVKMNLDGTERQYRVLSVNGNVCKVMAMYDTLTSEWNTDNLNTTVMGTLTVANYDGSDIDIYLNTTWYNTLTDTAKAAIVPENVVCDAWYFDNTGDPDYTGTYGNSVLGTNNYTISKYAGGTLNIGNRNVFALGVQDVIDYLNDSSVQVDTTAILRNVNIWKMFWNDEVSYSNKYILLRSSRANDNNYAWNVDGSVGRLSTYFVLNSIIVRPALNLDMSKIQYTLVQVPPPVIETETWVIKDNAPVDENSYTLTKTDISFTSGGEKFVGIEIYNDGIVALSLTYYKNDNTTKQPAAFDYSLGGTQFYWNAPAYKTLVFDTPPTGDLLTWLQANATKQ